MNGAMIIPYPLIAMFVSIAIAFVAAWLQINTRIRVLEVKVSMVEKQDDRILQKLEDMGEDLQEIKLDLQNKQNK